MKSFKEILLESEEVVQRIEQVTNHLESKRRRIPINNGDGLLAGLEASHSRHANDFHGHGSKTIKGTVTLLHGMGDMKKGLHSMPWRVDKGAAAGFGATAPYTNTPTGFIFHKSMPDHAIGIYVHPESGLHPHIRELVPQEFPVIHTHEIRSFLDSAGTRVDSKGIYQGPKIDLFGRSKNK